MTAEAVYRQKCIKQLKADKKAGKIESLPSVCTPEFWKLCGDRLADRSIVSAEEAASCARIGTHNAAKPRKGKVKTALAAIHQDGPQQTLSLTNGGSGDAAAASALCVCRSAARLPCGQTSDAAAVGKSVLHTVVLRHPWIVSCVQMFPVQMNMSLGPSKGN
jgi:hypothetical protein